MEEEDDDDSGPRFVSDFKKVHKKYLKLRCQCPEGKRLSEEYLKYRELFDKLKSEFG